MTNITGKSSKKSVITIYDSKYYRKDLLNSFFYNCYNKSVIAFNNRLSSATAVGVKKQV